MQLWMIEPNFALRNNFLTLALFHSRKKNRSFLFVFTLSLSLYTHARTHTQSNATSVLRQLNLQRVRGKHDGGAI